MPVAEIEMAGHKIDVIPQPHAYLTKRAGGLVAKLAENGEFDVSGVGLAVFFGDKTYEALVALIPTIKKRIQPWEFHGYATREAWEAGEEIDEDSEPHPPTWAEIVHAFEVAVKVNRFDVFGAVGKYLDRWLDPTELAPALNKRLKLALLEMGSSEASTTSPSSQRTNGASASTSSGTTLPASTENVA